ncbi:MAG: hypothetical protein D6701_13755, partial [Gemmatimonadetes bacterium]
ELLEAGLERGGFVSFSGLVTFRSFDDEDAVRRVPAERLLVETDAPYLAPVPHRGRRNEPSFVPRTVARLAEIRGEDPAALGELTERNARRFYNLEAQG